MRQDGEIKIGFLVNPYAGIGGPFGLKGSDNDNIRDYVSRDGVEHICLDKAMLFLRYLGRLFTPHETPFTFLTAEGKMGEFLLDETGFINYHLAYRSWKPYSTQEDTILAARAIHEQGASCLIFAGGDGTARDVHSAIKTNIPVIAIPGGVKMHSSVFAHTPSNAATMLKEYILSPPRGQRLADVISVDEEACCNERISTCLSSHLLTPETTVPCQGTKVSGWDSEQKEIRGAAQSIIESMDKSTLFLLGPGTTPQAILDELGCAGSLLGVDVLVNKKTLFLDMDAQQLLNVTRGRPFRLVITPIGGQGCLIGRGNTQLRPELIRRCGKLSIIVIASRKKLASIKRKSFYNDTGNEALDRMLTGPYRVITGKDSYITYPCQ